MSVTFSIIAPIFNELENIPELYRRVRDVMSSTRDTWELVLVDDGSSDGSTEAIRALAQQDKHVCPVIFARNFGHQVAITAGWDYARGEAVIIMDADLQDPPEVIPELIAKWREGFEVVYAVRAEREGETWFKKTTAAVFYRIVHHITDVKIPMDSGDFRLMDRKVVDVLKSNAREVPFPTRHVGLGGLPADRGALQAGNPLFRYHQVSLQQDVQTGLECHHRLLLFSATTGHLFRLCLRRPIDRRDSCGDYHAPDWTWRFPGTGYHAHSRVVPRRRAVDFTGRTGRIPGENL